jgi:flagellar hook-associated protein 1
MYGLNATLSLASQALSAESGALAVTNSNITNVNTVGYSREVVNLTADSLTGSNGAVQEDGVSFNGYTSVRDELLGIAIQQKTSDAASLTAQSSLWSQIETGFSSTTTGVGASLSGLFSTLSALSTTPANAGARQSALSAAGSLVDAFHQAAATLTSAQAQANSNITGLVANINQLTTQIASLDQQLASVNASGQDGGSIEDQRDQLTTQLAGLVGITSTSTQSTPSLSTAHGSPLVVNGTAYALQVTQASDGQAHIFDTQGNDITASVTGGSLGGALTMRDTSIPQTSASLDTLANQFATAMNAAQAQGYDANGTAGAAMFTLPTDGSSAAAGITLALTNASGLALSSDGSPGSSGNLTNLLAVQANPLPGGQTPTNTYAGLAEAIGTTSAGVSNTLTATNAALAQLTTQQGSESGVSIDEETTNLLRFQQAYTAAAKVVSVVNDLYAALMNMGVAS